MSSDDPNDPTLANDPLFGLLRCVYASKIAPMWLEKFGLEREPEPVAELWEGELELMLGGALQRFTLCLDSADWAEVLRKHQAEGEFAPVQREAFRSALAAWPAIEAQLLPQLLTAYRECLALIDYGHDRFGPVSDVAELLPRCNDWRLTVPRCQEPALQVEISCACPWEEEHGFRATFVDGQLSHSE